MLWNFMWKLFFRKWTNIYRYLLGCIILSLRVSEMISIYLNKRKITGWYELNQRISDRLSSSSPSFPSAKKNVNIYHKFSHVTQPNALQPIMWKMFVCLFVDFSPPAWRRHPHSFSHINKRHTDEIFCKSNFANEVNVNRIQEDCVRMLHEGLVQANVNDSHWISRRLKTVQLAFCSMDRQMWLKKAAQIFSKTNMISRLRKLCFWWISLGILLNLSERDSRANATQFSFRFQYSYDTFWRSMIITYLKFISLLELLQ